jgi:3-phosphoshikimate 1-carboxyvinyltransferase
MVSYTGSNKTQSVTLPPSKSMAVRGLLISNISGADLPGVAEVGTSDDVAAMRNAIADLHNGNAIIHAGASGATFRFLTAYLATCNSGKTITLTGTERLLQRPLLPLIEALRELGAQIEYNPAEGIKSPIITGRKLSGGLLHIDGNISSQFLSALLLSAPLMENGLTLLPDGKIVSRPYIEMTVSMMRQAGVDITMDADDRITVKGKYNPAVKPFVEADWSAASYFYEISALTGNSVAIERLTCPKQSLQGDSFVADLSEKIGVSTDYSDNGSAQIMSAPGPADTIYQADLDNAPDLAPAVVVMLCMRGIPFKLRGTGRLRDKESDRGLALQCELRKLGCEIELSADAITFDGTRKAIATTPEIATYSDHRIAMAFAPAAAVIGPLVIRNCDVVSKSFPDYFDNIARLGFNVEELSQK